MQFKSIVMDDPSQRISLPRLGKIRLGVLVEGRNGGRSYPRELSHFVVPEEVQAVYGEKPTELEVLVPSLPLPDFFPQRLAAYGTNQKLLCEGNGEEAKRRNKDTREWMAHSCPCEWLDEGKCAKQGLLFVILPRVNYGGVYQMDTGSSTSMSNLNSTLRFLISMVGIPNLSRVPIKLRRQETLIEDKQGRAQKHWPIYADIQLPPESLKTLIHTQTDHFSPPLLPEFIEEGPLPDTPIIREDEEGAQAVEDKLEQMSERLASRKETGKKEPPAKSQSAPEEEQKEPKPLDKPQSRRGEESRIRPLF